MMSRPSCMTTVASPTSSGAATSNDSQFRALRAALWTKDAARLAWLLASDPAAISHVDKDGNGLLALALAHGCDLELIEILLDAGADPGAANAKGDTALHAAFRRKQYEPALIERMLTWVYEEPRQRMWRFCARRDAGGSTACQHAVGQWSRGDPLWQGWAAEIAGWQRTMAQAAVAGDLTTLQALLAGAVPVSLPLDGDRTALAIASQRGDTAMALMLVEEAKHNGEPVIDQRVGKAGRTALAMAVQAGHLETVHVLLAAGATGDLADLKGNTPLMIAARSGDAQIAYVLLQAGADLRAANQDGATPLSIATQHCRAEVVDVLLDWGGHGLLHACNARDETPLEQAAGLVAPQSVDAQWRTIEVLLSHGAAIDGAGAPDHSPLQRAIAVGNFAVGSRLIARGAGATPKMIESLQALRRAIEAGDVEGMPVPPARRDAGDAMFDVLWESEAVDVGNVEDAQAWHDISVDATSGHRRAVRDLLGRIPGFENLARDAIDFVASQLDRLNPISRSAQAGAAVLRESTAPSVRQSAAEPTTAVVSQPAKRDKGKQKEVHPDPLESSRGNGSPDAGSGSGSAAGTRR